MHKRIKKRTLDHVPAKMAQTIDRVEGEWGSQDGLSGIFHTLRESSNNFHNIGAAECSRCDEVGDGEPIQHCTTTVA